MATRKTSPDKDTARTPVTYDDTRLPAPLRTLLDRLDASAMDFSGRVHLRLMVEPDGAWDLTIRRDGARVRPADARRVPEATLSADLATWNGIAGDLAGAMDAFRAGRLVVRHNLHTGIGFLAATNGDRSRTRLQFHSVDTGAGRISLLSAGAGDPVLLIHGLGATKGSFLTTLAALAPAFRVTALDLPGFGDSYKPLRADFDARFFAHAVVATLDALGIERAHLVGNSLGGRIALEVGLHYPQRVGRLGLLAPSLAWRRERPWAPLVRALRPELGLIQLTPRWAVEGFVHRLLPAAADTWVRAGVDEFLRAYLTPRGRVAFYAAARQIYLEEPHGAAGFWTRLAHLEPRALFTWGKQDRLVPIGFAAHVKRTLPSARHLELDCGHVPQLEQPEETHAVLAAFLRAEPLAGIAPAPYDTLLRRLAEEGSAAK
jgi:pimeloyl-ACP methyl ester carboxylesterase